ncbi:MAG: alpha-2-macroglobulin family protein [Thermodesulfobacteriota bacterium]
MKSLLKIIRQILVFFTGNFSWTPPPWFSFIKRFKLQSPFVFSFVSIAVAVSAAAVLAGCIYLFSGDSDLLKPQVTPPKITKPGQSPGELTIGFTVKDSDIKKFRSVADLSLAGEKIDTGVSLFPSLKGKWEWKDDKILVFYPEEDWPADKEFKISFDKSVFAKNIKLESYKAEFKTPEFKSEIKEFRFYTNPENRKIHKGVASLEFNYPVDPKSLKNLVSLSIEDKNIDYDVKFDEFRRKAFIHSKPLKIEANKKYLKLLVDKGIATTAGGAATKEKSSDTVVIPSMESFFKIKSLNTDIIRDQENNPVQSLVLSFTDRVDPEELKDKVNIYLLPEKKNKRRWNSPAEINDSLLQTAEKAEFEFASTAGKTSDSLGIILDLPENRDIYISIDSGIESESGFYLTKKFDDVVRIPSYPKELEIVGSGGILSLSGSRKLSFKTRGLKAVKVEVSRLLENQVQHLISQGRGDLNQLRFPGYYFSKDSISEKFEKIIPLNLNNPKEAVYSSFDLSQYLNRNGKTPGFFFVDAKGWNPEKKRYVNVSDNRSVLVTDLLLLVKKNADDSRDVFVHSVSSGEPVKGAEVFLLGKNGLSVLKASSDKDGHVFFKNTNDFRNEKEPVACVAKSGKDISFIELGKRSRELNVSSFDTGGVRSRYFNSDKIDGFLFSDRGIYRPGEKFNIGAVIRHKKLKVPQGIPLEYAVYDARGNERLKKRVKVPASGFFDISYKTELTDPTGNWTCRIYLVSEKGYRTASIGSETVKIETFQPDRLKIKSRLSESEKGWINPKDLSADVTLLNLFGSPAQKRKVTAKLNLKPSGFYFSEFENYKFTDPYYSPDRNLKSVEKRLENSLTDENGKASFNLDLDSYEKGTYSLRLEIQGYEKGEGRSVSAVNKALVSPLDTLIGYKSGSDLSYLKKDSEHKIDLIAVDKSLQKRSKKNLTLKLKEIREAVALVKKNDGTYTYNSVKKENLKKEKAFDIPAKGKVIVPETENSGEYAFEIYEDDDVLVSRIEYFVAGASNEAGLANKNSEIKLNLDNKDVKAGGYIEADIKVPYKGSGLISIESDKVHAYKWFKTDASGTVEKIKVPENLEGNAYFSVSMVRAFDDPSVFQTPFTYAVEPFNIDRSGRTLKPEISVPEKVKPGDSLKIGYLTPKKAKIALFAADEGILQVADYKTPKPLDHFFRKKALEVNTYQIADLIIPDYEILKKRLAPGGGLRYAQSSKLLAANLNPFQRAINDPAVKWFGILDSGKEEKTVSWTVPDTFNGNIKIMAVAADENSMGSASEDVLIRGPFVITPSLPKAVTFKDEFIISVNTTNLIEESGKNLPVSVTVEADSGVSIKGEKTKTISIDENGETSVDFTVSAKNTPGNVGFRFYARSGDKTSKTSSSLSVRPPSSYRTTLESGISKKDEKTLKLNRILLSDFADQSASASKSPLIFINSLYSWLDEFPHGCTEQIISKAFPVTAFAGISGYMEKFGKKAQTNIEKAFNALRQRQTSSGGFALWPGGNVHDFSSLYSFHFLMDAGEAGFEIPGDLFRRSISWLNNKASDRKEDIYSIRIRSYAVYLLTRAGQRTSNHIADIEEILEAKDYKDDIAEVFLAGAYKLLKDDYSADKKIKTYILENSPEEGRVWFADNVADSLYIYILGKHFPDELKKLSSDKVNEILKPLFEGNFNTLSSSFTILALGAWTDSQGKISDESFSFEFASENRSFQKAQTKESVFPQAEIPLNSEKVKIKGNSPWFYSLVQSGYDKTPSEKAVSNKIEVIRKFETPEGEEAEEIKPGDDIVVILKIRTLTGKTERNIAVTDLFAGGFYPDTESIRKNQKNRKIDYIDIREDRAVFYSSFSPEVTTIKYTARASAKGEFILPSVQAESLYDPGLSAVTGISKISVK